MFTGSIGNPFLRAFLQTRARKQKHGDTTTSNSERIPGFLLCKCSWVPLLVVSVSGVVKIMFLGVVFIPSWMSLERTLLKAAMGHQPESVENPLTSFSYEARLNHFLVAAMARWSLFRARGLVFQASRNSSISGSQRIGYMVFPATSRT